jgi:UDP-N-acetylglucosamine 4,6-dehydratase
MTDLKHVLLLGGAGTLGTALYKNIVKMYPHVKITIASRNEHKHQELKKIYPGFKFALCDIKDKSSLLPVMRNQDVVFHVAALKHVDYLEDNPIECYKTNVQGTINVAEACIESEVKFCAFSSTDKAVDPINTYGYCKALSEKLLHDFNKKQMDTRFSIFRWGNICNSQGSAIPYFIQCLKRGERIPLTSDNMTRFWIDINEAAQFMLQNYNSRSPDAQIPPTMKSSSVLLVIEALADLLDVEPAHRIVGLRPGEKLHESLTSKHSVPHIESSTADKYSFDELKKLLLPSVELYR